MNKFYCQDDKPLLHTNINWDDILNVQYSKNIKDEIQSSLKTTNLEKQLFIPVYHESSINCSNMAISEIMSDENDENNIQQRLKFTSPQGSTSILGSTGCTEVNESVSTSPSNAIYYKPEENDLISSTLSLPYLISSSDEISNSDDNNMMSTEDKVNDELSAHLSAIDSVSNILDIIHSWEISEKHLGLQPLRQQFKRKKDPNDINQLHGDKQPDNSPTKLTEKANKNGHSKGDGDNKGDGGDNMDNGEGGNEDDGKDDGDGNGDGNGGNGGDTKIKRLIDQQSKEIIRLKTKLIDRIIGDYYKMLGVNDYYDEGTGRFLQYVTNKNLNNGKPSLSEQLTNDYDPENSIYTHFDPEFPFPSYVDQSNMNDSEKHRIIFSIIQYCYRYEMPPTEQFIRENCCQIHCQKVETPVIDGLYKDIKQNMSESDITALKYILEKEEYDSEALLMDIVTDDVNNSNIIQLLKNKNECMLIQKYMSQNATEYLSSNELRLNPSSKLTRKIIPQIVAEEFENEADYMAKFILIHGHHAVTKCDNDKHLIVNYNFHCKNNMESVYVVCKRKNGNNYEWKMKDRLFKCDELKTMFRIHTTLKPIPMKTKPMLMYAFEENRKQILYLLQNKKDRTKLIQRKIPWTNRNKIPIFNKKPKRSGKSQSLSLYLTKEEWVKRLNIFANDNIDNINLIPIVTFNGNKYCIEIIWIVKIETNVNIGISLKPYTNYLKCESFIVLGIYLDINDEHRLVPYEHNCQCLNDFNCYIDDLRIGDSKQNQLKQQHKELQKKLNKANKRIKTLENQPKKQEIVIKSHLSESNMIHINIDSIDNKNDGNLSLENEEEKQEIISAEELTPNGSNNYQKNKISTKTTINTSENNKNNECSVGQYSYQCQNCHGVQALLNDKNQRIKLLEGLRAKDINTIFQIKNVSILLQSDLKKTQSFIQLLIDKQTELQQQQNRQQQDINNFVLSTINNNTT